MTKIQLQHGITIVEILVVIVIIGFFSSIMIANFPKIQRQLALSRAAYKLAQNIRNTQNLGFSGVRINDLSGDAVLAKGYGVFIDMSVPPVVEYFIYADVDGDLKFTGSSYINCSAVDHPQEDCIIEQILVNAENRDLYIKDIYNISATGLAGAYTSINFKPPNPTTTIDNICQTACDTNFPGIEIVLGAQSDDSLERIVTVNKAGLVEIP